MDELIESLQEMTCSLGDMIEGLSNIIYYIAANGDMSDFDLELLIKMRDNLEGREEYESCEKVQQEINRRL